MLAHIRKDIGFFAGVHFENEFTINLYECDLRMVVHTLDPREQAIAQERLVYFVTNHLQNCLIISNEEVEQIKKYETTGMRLCIVPDEPYDQILGLILINKFNAIMEGRIEVTDLVFGSRLSDYIKFELSQEDAESLYNQEDWYNENNTSLRSSEKPSKKKDKIVKLFDPDEWEKNGLTWKEKKT
jgi:hypothetical protein